MEPQDAGELSDTVAWSSEPPRPLDRALSGGEVEGSANSIATSPPSASLAAEEPWPDDVWLDELIQSAQRADSTPAAGAEPAAGEPALGINATRVVADGAGEPSAPHYPVVLDGADLNDRGDDVDSLGGLSAIYTPDLVTTWAASAGGERYQGTGDPLPASGIVATGPGFADPVA